MYILDFWESIKNSKKFLFYSFLILCISSIVFFKLLEIDALNSTLNNIIIVLGFSATIYSVFLTIVLYRFISLSDAEFVINSNIYVEKNKQEIISKALKLSNFMMDAINDKHNLQPKANIIPGEIRSDFIYLKNLNKKHVNERTSLYQCKETFNKLESLISETKIHEVAEVHKISLEKLNEIWEVLIELTTHLDTIFNNKE